MKKSSFWVMFLAIIAVTIAIPPKTEAPIHSYCVDGLTPESKAYCSNLVSGATSWEQASMWVVNRTMRFTNMQVPPLLKTIESKLVPNTAQEKKAEIVKTCSDSYADVVDGLQTMQKLIKSDPLRAYIPQVAYVSGCYKDCKEAIMKIDGQTEISELDRFNVGLDKIIDVIILLANKDPRLPPFLPINEQPRT